MDDPDRLGAALACLSASLQRLDAAAERRAAAEAGRADLDGEYLLLQQDRSRLAVELDGALARGSALLTANAEVIARLDRAGATVQAVIAQFEGSDGEDAPFVEESPPGRRAGQGRGE